MIKPQWLELPISRTNFHGPKDVRAIEVRLHYQNLPADMGLNTAHICKEVPFPNHHSNRLVKHVRLITLNEAV